MDAICLSLFKILRPNAIQEKSKQIKKISSHVQMSKISNKQLLNHIQIQFFCILRALEFKL